MIVARVIRHGVFFTASLLLIGPAVAAEADLAGIEYFEKHVRPLLVAKCYKCHAADTQKRGELVLDTKAGWEVGGESGETIAPGKPDESLLIEAVRYEGFEMPPDKQLSDKEIEILVEWVKMGAPDPRTEGGPAARKGIDIEEGRKYWAFQPPKKSSPPSVKKGEWPRSDIDRFLLAKQEAVGVVPVADADRLSLIRRVTFDLTGLPPTPDEVDDFVNDPAPPEKALQRVVDRLLASPRFGERWGRNWLDVARYGDSIGRNEMRYAWQYRDYVIKSINADKPFDQFIREQIAGDLMKAANDSQRDELIIATGFLALGNRNDGQRDEVVDEQIDCTTKAFMALTVACARCHDHKFDPIPTEDYYAMAGIFRSTLVKRGSTNKKVTPRPLAGGDANKYKTFNDKLDKFRRDMVRKKATAQRDRDRFLTALRSVENRYRGRDDDKPKPDLVRAQQQAQQAEKKFEQFLVSYNAAAEEINKLRPRMATAVTEEEKKKIADHVVYIRGDRTTRGDPVPRGFVQVATLDGSHLVQNKEQSGRLELAEWVANRENPLTARVIVNRAWHHLFGRGIVPTVDNFGAMGELPSHPELLDSLAVEFMDDGWSLKRLVRRIVLSRAYQLSTVGHTKNEDLDGDNRLVWRMNRRRLEAESIRDALLVFSGRLDLTPPAIGQSADPSYQRPEFDVPYRSVYLPVIREGGYDFFSAFDGPDTSIVVGRREVSTVPTQALYLLNSPLAMQESQRAAERLIASDDPDDAGRIDRAYRLAVGRPATDKEQQMVLAFLDRYPDLAKEEGKGFGDLRLQAWTQFCQALVASAEFQILN
jgi:hypothetical protein